MERGWLLDAKCGLSRMSVRRGRRGEMRSLLRVPADEMLLVRRGLCVRLVRLTLLLSVAGEYKVISRVMSSFGKTF